ncbi:type II toxin-antitoxin system HicB family antitoxin [Cohnella soli]|uniref:Type II toxin-antitoxin system HicB family antitoxin n=1 Tax=Cohnella soli TaxID=425005 RepID=A0ABW0HR84_9BACL
MEHEQQFLVLFEEDKMEKNFTAYIPAFRLGARGDTLEEARENAKDLAQMAIALARISGKSLPQGDAIVESITVATI